MIQRLILTTAITAALAAASTVRAAERPNILFCFADDWGRYASAYADVIGRPSPSQVVKTPNIDHVAARGVLFKNAFVTAPSCTPCRSSLLSGQYFFRTGRGAILQGAVWDPAIPSFPLMLQCTGYHIGETYKVWSPGTPNDAPFGAGKYAYEKAGGAYNNFSENVTKMVAGGTPAEEAKQKLYAEVRGNFEDFLKARPAGQPFCYWFGPTLVHRAWQKGSGKALWGIEPDALKGKLPKFLPDVPEVREDFADYLGEIQGLDAGIGVLLKKLEEVGELDRTLIVISGDHGAPGFTHGKCNLYNFGVGVTLAACWPGGKGGRVVDDFVNLMDLAPTFLEAGGLTPPPEMTGRSLVNVLKSDKSGQVDPERTWVVTGRERHVGVAREGNLPYPHRALRTKDFLYIRNFAPDRWPMGAPYNITDTTAPSADALAGDTRVTFADMDSSPTKAWLVAHRNDPQGKAYYDFAFAKRPGEELYDLRTDPDEVKNVADDPSYAETKRELGGRLIKILTDAEDPRVTGDGGTFDRPPFSDPEPERPARKKARPGAPGPRRTGEATMKNFVVGLLCLTWLAGAAHAADAPRTNVLFIMSDDYRPELGCYGSPALTPRLDRLAKQGVQFDRAYCQQAVCNPSRSSMLTGLRPDTLKLWCNGTHFREYNPYVVTMPQWFKQHGYTTRCVGKIFHNWHNAVHGDRQSWSAPEFLHFANHGEDKPVVTGSLPTDHAKAPKCECRDVPDEAYYDGRVAAEAVRVLAEVKGEPFFLAVGFWKPHAPFNAPKKYWDLVDPTKLPKLNPARPEGAPEVAFHDGREIRGIPPNQVTFTSEQADEIRHGYFANIAYLDAQLGKVLDALAASGVADRTVIVFAGDHGYHIGEQGLWGKTSTFELDAHVPLLIAAPGAAAGRRTESLAELLDLYPTLVDLCGLPKPEGLEGASLVPVLKDPAKSVKPAAFSQHPRPAYYDREPDKTPQAMGHSVRTAKVRYTEWRNWQTGKVIARELYDAVNDPAEMRNAIDASHLAEARQEAEQLLQRQFPLAKR